jgi:hypothetical protein
MSTKSSEGVKLSGLLCCDTDSPLCVDLAVRDFFGTGRIHGGRVLSAKPFEGADGSKGIWLTGRRK